MGRLLHYQFRGLLSVHSRYNLQTHQSPYATLSTRGFSGFVASTAAPIATGWSDPVPGRVFSPAVDQRLSRRTVIGSRVENRRSGFSLSVAVGLAFAVPASIRLGVTLFPVPAHRTGQADFPHPALGKDTRLIGKE